MEIKIKTLKANPNNPRGAIVHDDDLRELAMSIKSQGVLQPLLATSDHVVICGHRRLEAAKLAGCETVPVVIKDFSETEQLAVMLAENLQRKDLNVVQEGKAYLALQSRGLSINKISKAIGIHNARITRLVEVVSLPEECHAAFASGQIAFGRVTCLTDLEPPQQIFWVKKAIANKWNGAQLQEAINAEDRERKPKDPPPIIGARRLAITKAVRKLEDVDETLDPYPEFRATQTLLRQAMNLLLDENEKVAA